MNLIRIFTAILTLGIMSSSNTLWGQTTYYKAAYSIKKEKAQDQYYKVEQKNGTMTIQERGIFVSNPKIYAFSESKMDSVGYKSVEIAFRNGKMKSHVIVKRADNNSNMYYSYFNGTLVDSILTDNTETLLFDGPNPTFDVLNAQFLKRNKKESTTLVLINWIKGTLSTEKAYYIVGKSEVAVHKKRTKRVSFLFLEENEILPKSCYQNKESYEFKRIDKATFKRGQN